MSSSVLLGSSQNQIDMIGEPVRTSSYYGYDDGIHTIAIYLGNFIGRIYIEGTLETNPQDYDWFPIKIHPEQTTYYIEYSDSNEINTNFDGGSTGIYTYTFKCNCLYLRARIERNYFINPYTTSPEKLEMLGQVRQILLSL